MNIQRLRNLTTHRLHTQMSDIYEDLEWIIGESGIMTHMIPRVCDAVTPWLKLHVTDERFWDGQYDVSHVGEFALPTPTVEERAEMLRLYAAMPNPLATKDVVAVFHAGK